jgi:hypothetical protein
MSHTDTAFKIVSHKDAQDTEDEVNSLLKDHYWELHGDLKVTNNGFVQAMVKREYHEGIDQSVFVTIEELDMVRYSLDSIGEAIETLAKAVGYAASDTTAEPPKPSPATKPTKAKRKPSKK